MPGFFKAIGNLLTGTPEKHERVSTLLPSQQGAYNDLQAAAQGKSSKGAFGKAANYYGNLLSDDSADYNAFAAPALRQYNQDIIPNIAEQFAGMGSGGLSSSGFQNAQIQGATDLSERLGALRAQLRQQGAQGLQNIGQLGLQNFSQDVMTQPGTEGILAPALGAVGTAIGGPALGAFGSMAGNWLKNSFAGKSSPYGGNSGGAGMRASPQMPQTASALPNFDYNRR
jgi:hypothetical protein